MTFHLHTPGYLLKLAPHAASKHRQSYLYHVNCLNACPCQLLLLWSVPSVHTKALSQVLFTFLASTPPNGDSVREMFYVRGDRRGRLSLIVVLTAVRLSHLDQATILLSCNRYADMVSSECQCFFFLVMFATLYCLLGYNIAISRFGCHSLATDIFDFPLRCDFCQYVP